MKVVIFNNGVLGFVALEMKASGFIETGVDLQNPDFAAMARAMGIHAVRVEDPGDLPRAIRDVLAHDGPAVLDVVTATQELSMPPTITAGADQGLQSVGASGGDERPWRRSAGSGKDQPVIAMTAAAGRILASPAGRGSSYFFTSGHSLSLSGFAASSGAIVAICL